LLLPVALAVLWEVAVRIGLSNGRLVPPPSVIWNTFADLAATGELARHALATLWRVACGFVFGVAAGTPASGTTSPAFRRPSKMGSSWARYVGSSLIAVQRARAREMDFGPPVFEVELGYLVKGSAVTTLAEVDAPGIRVGVTAGSSSDATLSRDLKQAEIVRAANFDAAIEMLSAGRLNAYATNKASLFEMADKLPGSKVLDGRWGVEHFAIGIPKGRDQGMAFIRRFTEAAKSEGLVKAAITRAGLRGAVTSEAQK
jgi:ABC-type amino acid transport substrate-binding protein